MSGEWRAFCDDAELAVECALAASALGLALEPEVDAAAVESARAAVLSGRKAALVVSSPPPPASLVRLAAAARGSERPLGLCVLAGADACADALQLAADLGLLATRDVRPLVAGLALTDAGAEHPWTASTRALTRVDRVRLGGSALESGRGGGRLVRLDDGGIGWVGRGSDRAVALGPPEEAGEALCALRLAAEAAPPARAVLDGVDARAVQEVIFGPPRALSDPASKSALEPYGLPLPIEELCTSPSRAASEAARIGFPVRIALASPDLRVWDHPDLAVDGVDNAARVKDVYRQIMAMANERQPEARLLGVHVTATTRAQALLRITAEPLPEGRVLAEIGFADPHGRASADRTITVLPAGVDAVERVLSRLRGAPLLLEGTAAQRRATVAAVADVLLRLAAFVDAHGREVERVEVHPLAILVGGTVEVREACVVVGDAFLRSLEASPLITDL